MIKRVLLISMTAIFFCSYNNAFQHQDKSDEGPYFLFICAEDLSPLLTCYGDTIAQTPRLDKLAKQGDGFNESIGRSVIKGDWHLIMNNLRYRKCNMNQNNILTII